MTMCKQHGMCQPAPLSIVTTQNGYSMLLNYILTQFEFVLAILGKLICLSTLLYINIHYLLLLLKGKTITQMLKGSSL